MNATKPTTKAAKVSFISGLSLCQVKTLYPVCVGGLSKDFMTLLELMTPKSVYMCAHCGAKIAFVYHHNIVSLKKGKLGDSNGKALKIHAVSK